MVRLIAYLLTIALFAAGLSWLADRPGTLQVVWQGYDIETSVFRAVVLLAAAVASIVFLLSVLRAIWNSPAVIGHRIVRRRQKIEPSCPPLRARTILTNPGPTIGGQVTQRAGRQHGQAGTADGVEHPAVLTGPTDGYPFSSSARRLRRRRAGPRPLAPSVVFGIRGHSSTTLSAQVTEDSGCQRTAANTRKFIGVAIRVAIHIPSRLRQLARRDSLRQAQL